MRRLAALVVVGLAVAHGAPAGELNRRCVEAGADAAVCAWTLTIEDALQRPGISIEDFSTRPTANLEIADFYFAPRIAIVRDGQTVSFTNANPSGGNSHSIASSDWGGTQPVLPIPVVSFGGGAGFRSGKLEPGTTANVIVDVAALDPASYLLLPTGDALIAYHCYIHGSAQMNGLLLVQGAAA